MRLNFMYGAALAAAALSASAASADPAPLYKWTASIPLGAPDRWDYVVFDASSKRVYVAHGTEVSVVDAQANTVVGAITGFTGGTHGIAISPATHTGYTDDGKAGAAFPFDPVTLKAAAPIATAEDADGIAFDPKSGHVLVINGESGSVSVIDPASNAVVATIAVGAGLEFGVADGQGNFFVDGAEKNEMVRIDTATNAVDAHWPIAGCESPHGIAMDEQSRRLFASCANSVMAVMDADSGAVLATLPIGKYTDGAVFDPVRKRAISANGDGTLSIVQEVDATHFVELPTVTTVPSARTIAIDPATGRLYLAAADIAKVDPPTTPGGRLHVEYVPGSLKLLVFEPAS